jgi:hypothetical protein
MKLNPNVKVKNASVNALLVKLSISIFSNQRQDREITDDVKSRKALGNGAGKWVKFKFPDKMLEPIRKVANEVRTFHYNHTSPWEDGQRLLSGKVNAKYEERMTAYSAEFWEVVDAIKPNYDSWIEQARIMHAGTFDSTDYPDWEGFRNTFAFGREYYPVPKPEHFNVEMKELYGAGLVAITEKKIGEAVADTWDRMMKPVMAMAEKLTKPDAVFRDTLVENVKEMVELVPALNLTEDPALTKAATEIGKQLAAFKADDLRNNKVVRKDAAEKAAKLVERFGAVGKRKLANN